MNELSLFGAALEMDDPVQRAAFLERASGADDALRERVKQLLKAHDQAAAFMDQPAMVADSTAECTSKTDAGLSRIREPGTIIGHYKLLHQIGEGGMGIVFLAEQQEPVHRHVAFKIIKPGMDSRQVIARFEAERQALALMDHPNIAKILDAGVMGEPGCVSAGRTRGADETPLADGRPYFVMELVQGMPITRYCDELRLSLRERLELFVPVCQAIQHAHQKGIIHRDIKPSNILVASYDGKPVPKVIDFGVAKAMGQKLTEKTLCTGIGGIVGTLEYMSPEQAEFNSLDIDTRSDLYSLGVLLYELLTGSTPFERARLRAASFVEVLRIIREEAPPTPSNRLGSSNTLAAIAASRNMEPGRLGRMVRGELDWMVMKALEKDRSRRYETADSFARDVLRYLNDEPVEAGPPSLVYKFRKFSRRHRTFLSTSAAFVLFLTAAASISVWLAVRANEAKAEALQDRLRAEEEAAVARAVSAFLSEGVLGQATVSGQVARDREFEPQLTVRVALDRAAQMIAGRFDQQPRVEVNIRKAIGNAYLELSEYGKAQEQLEQAGRLARQLWGDDDAETLFCESDLALAFLRQGKLTEGEQLLSRVLQVHLLQRGHDHPYTLKAAHNLGLIFVDQGRYLEAETLLSGTLAGQRQALGEQHRDTLRTMDALATAYQYQAKDDQAERLHERVYEITERLFGAEHPDTLSAMNNLALDCIYQRKFAKAEPLATKLLAICRRTSGVRNARTISALNDLALLYQEQGKFALAEDYYSQSLEAARVVYGDANQYTLIAMQNLAKVYHDQKKVVQAEALCRQALEGRRKLLGEDHPQTVLSKRRMARIYRDQGKFEAAEALFAQVVDLDRRKGTADKSDLAGSLTELGDTRLDRRAFQEAEAPLRELLAISANKSADNWRLFDSQCLLGASLAGQGKFAEAETLLIGGLEGMKSREKELPPRAKGRLVQTGSRIIQLYEDWGKTDQAAKWRARLQPQITPQKPQP